MLAAVGAGIYPDIPAAAENMVHTANHSSLTPSATRSTRLRDRYLESYHQMKELMHRTERHVAGGGRRVGMPDSYERGR